MAKDSGPGARELAVLGSPIQHSLSPVLHSAAYRVLGLDWRYSSREVKPGELAGFIAGLGPEWRGLSLTMPLKQEVLPLITDLDRVAKLTGAANTVLLSHESGRPTLSGFNTDVVGIVRALAENGTASASHVSILGGGATASSALMAAAELGAETVDILVRTPPKAAPLVALGRSLGVVVTVSDITARVAGPGPADLVISTLPGGAQLDVALPDELRRSAVLFDVSYSPWPSALAQSWLDASGTVVSGLPMLLHQALIQVRIFVAGDPFEPLPDEDAVLAAMRAALDEGASTPAK
ncbi:MAG TPA: shikimate dehydrogenase [Glaciibacter sp.]|nr:shikimate dehydrogenase [Glaciibacter sp.]